MDRVRFGRVLGKGARLAARTAFEAVDAATAPAPGVNPSPRRDGAARPVQSSRPSTGVPQGSAGVPQRSTGVPQGQVLRPRSSVIAQAGKGAATTAFAPWRAASRALWHELTGSFFALFALSFGAGVWHTRSAMTSAQPADRYRFYTFCGLALIFAYFSVSSFVRAKKRPA